MRIGFDFNGVITDSSFAKVQVAKKFLGVELEYARTVKRSLAGSLSEEQYDLLQKLVYWTSCFLETPAVSGVIPLLAGQLAQGHEVYCVTHLAPEGVQFGRQWLAERNLPRGMLISVGRGGEKRWVLEAGFDVYVDDHADELETVRVPHRVLLSTSYNRQDQTADGVMKVDDMSHLQVYLDGLSHSYARHVL